MTKIVLIYYLSNSTLQKDSKKLLSMKRKLAKFACTKKVKSR